MSLAPAMATALAQPFVRAFFAVRIVLSTTTINLVDASIQVAIPVNGTPVTFSGSDPIFGTLNSVDQLRESITDSAPQMSVVLYPSSLSALSALSARTEQGAPVLIWFCALNEQTGGLISQELLWSGVLDQVKITEGELTRTAELTVSSCFERMFAVDEAERLNSASHQAIWPGETGFDRNIEALDDPYWGSDVQTPAPTQLPSVLSPNDRFGGYRFLPG